MLSWMKAAFFLHVATAMADVDYAMRHRDVSPQLPGAGPTGDHIAGG
jgi:hypothetical protein